MTQTQKAINWVSNNGGRPRQMFFPEASGQSYLAGELVYLSGGKITVMATDDQVCLGIAQANWSATDTSSPVIVLYPDDKLEITVYHSSSSSAITAVAQVGENYALLSTGNKSYYDIEDTSAVLIRIVGIRKDNVYTVGDVYGRAYCHIMGDKLQSGQGG